MNGKLKRRSSLMGIRRQESEASNSSQQTTSSMEEGGEDLRLKDQDEETERRERKGRIKKRNSIGGGGGHQQVQQGGFASPKAVPGTPGTPSQAGNTVSGLSAAQLATQYNYCIKLSAENKINQKNAFQLKLIEILTNKVLSNKKSGNAGANFENFQQASCALDASTKIYAYRVDSVHQETLKLASGVGNTKNETEGNQGDPDRDGEDDDDDEEAKKKTTKRKKKAALTVEKNLANINCSKFELEFDVDPLFKKVSQQFDSGAGGGQFLSTLNLRGDCCEMLLDSLSCMDGGQVTNQV